MLSKERNFYNWLVGNKQMTIKRFIELSDDLLLSYYDEFKMYIGEYFQKR